LIRKLKDKLEDLSKELRLRSVVLFGSYAQERYTVGSDVDLLVVYEGGEDHDAFAKVKKTLDIPLLEPHVYSEENYERAKEVLDRMISKGIVLYPSGPES
jgi:hypothetical protein